MRRFAWAFLVLAAIYGGFLAATYAAMLRPPDQFAQFMSRLPSPAMMLLPFPLLWNSARRGTLTPGDAAPDFAAATVDKQSRLRFSDYRAGKPAVLVFGSYT